ncbi:MAG: 50S ribosomal protein L30 [Bacteroidota bacterium]
MAKLRITQTKSAIKRPERQKRTLRALGITKLNQTVELDDTPQVLGLIKKVEHMLTVEKA